MNGNRQPVNVLPSDLSPVRLETLLAEYRRRLHDPQPGDPPEWYCHAIIDALEASLNDRPAAS